jgi:hypothetical protein
MLLREKNNDERRKLPSWEWCERKFYRCESCVTAKKSVQRFFLVLRFLPFLARISLYQIIIKGGTDECIQETFFSQHSNKSFKFEFQNFTSERLQAAIHQKCVDLYIMHSYISCLCGTEDMVWCIIRNKVRMTSLLPLLAFHLPHL